jgi:hypothetical protein
MGSHLSSVVCPPSSVLCRPIEPMLRRPCCLVGAGCALLPAPVRGLFLSPARLALPQLGNVRHAVRGRRSAARRTNLIHAWRGMARPWRRTLASRRSTAAFALVFSPAPASGRALREDCAFPFGSSAPVPLIGSSRLEVSGRRKPPSSASSWQAARSGRRAEPRRRPGARRARHARGRRILPRLTTPHEAPLSERDLGI